MRTRRLLLLTLLSLCPAGGALAAPVTVHFEGAIDVVNSPDQLQGTGIGVGTPFSGFYSLDPVGAFPIDDGDLNPGLPPIFALTAPMTLHLEVGSAVVDVVYDFVVEGLTSDPFTGTYFGAGAYVWSPLRAFASRPAGGIDVAFAFIDDEATRPDVTELAAVTSLAGWDRSVLVLMWNDQFPLPAGVNRDLAFGALRSVPEPDGLPLLCVLALAAGSLRRRHTS